MSPTGQPVSIEYRCEAIVSDDSSEFAQRLQDSLNRSSHDGFVMQTMLLRDADKGLVLVYQRATLMGREDSEFPLGEPQPGTPTQGMRH
jgi:hypothetical protein